jgi:signal transduction histidine kinase
VAIAISYLVLAVQDWNLTDAGAGLLIIASLLSAVVVQRIADGNFHKRFMQLGLLLFDSLLIVSAMVIREQTAWDLLLLFFFCVFIAAIADNLIQVGIASLLLTVVFLLFVSPTAKDALRISPDLLVRVPFMFGISLFYGYMSSHFREEKQQMERREEKLRLKRQFAAAVAHDIKTPLNIILGHAELLGGEYWHQEKSTQRAHSLRCIQQNVDRIVQLVADFLTVSKLETLGLGLAIARVQMNIVIEEVVAEQMITAHEKNLTITIDLDRHLKPVLGDHDQLRRALGNLVSNAIKFTPPNGSINVTSRMIKEEVSIGVADTGPGIPKEDLRRLFSQFTRLNGDASTEGSGLGLFIVKTIVETHHGRVKVDSDSSVGTTFTILLPACKQFLAANDHHPGNNAPLEVKAPDNATQQ